MLSEYYNLYNDVSLQFEIISDDDHIYIVDNNTKYSDTDSNLNEDALQDAEEKILGSIFTTEQYGIIELIKLLEDKGYLDDAYIKIVT